MIALMTLAVVTTALSIYGYFLFPTKTDLMARYREGEAWLRGAPLYQPVPSVNMYPPWVTLLVFGPMARLPFFVVQLVCLVLNGVALVWSLQAIARTLGLSARQIVAMTAVLLSLHGMYQSWVLGQFTGLLLLPTTLAWIAFREERHVMAGAWLAPVIALKPTFAVLALLLPVRVWLSAGSLSFAITMLGVAATGFDLWREWLKAGSEVDWLWFPFNASLWGAAARWQTGGGGPISLTDLHPFALIGVTIVIGLIGWHAIARRNRDLRFFFATVVSILASPLGWIYYVPLVAGPAMATWPGWWLAVAACAVLVSPMLGPLYGAGPLLGSMYFIALAIGWVAWGNPQGNQGHGERRGDARQ